MKYAIILSTLLLSACSTTVPVKAKFPTIPDQLIEPCPELQQLGEGAKLSDVAKSVTENYTTYHQCSVKVDGFAEWYKTQKQIFEEVK